MQPKEHIEDFFKADVVESFYLKTSKLTNINREALNSGEAAKCLQAFMPEPKTKGDLRKRYLVKVVVVQIDRQARLFREGKINLITSPYELPKEEDSDVVEEELNSPSFIKDYTTTKASLSALLNAGDEANDRLFVVNSQQLLTIILADLKRYVPAPAPTLALGIIWPTLSVSQSVTKPSQNEEVLEF